MPTVRAIASMGPPRFSGGKDRRGSDGRPRGRSFNGAAAFQRRKAPRAPHFGSPLVVASMGPPRFSGGKQVARYVDLATPPDASMGPPRFSGGKLRALRGRPRAASASMGPPRFSGGKVITNDEARLYISALQWGRRVSAAESWPPGYIVSRTARLQWGRRVSAAESRRSGQQSGRPRSRFNGAAAFQRRKVVIDERMDHAE